MRKPQHMSLPSRSLRDRDAILRQVRLLVAALSASARAVEQRTGVTNAQLFLLRALADGGPMGVGQLAERARTQVSSVSILVSRLAAKGLVTKVRLAADRRAVSIALTPAARRLLRRAPEPPTARLLNAIEALSHREASALARALAPLMRRFAPVGAEAPMLFERAAARRGKNNLTSK